MASSTLEEKTASSDGSDTSDKGEQQGAIQKASRQLRKRSSRAQYDERASQQEGVLADDDDSIDWEAAVPDTGGVF